MDSKIMRKLFMGMMGLLSFFITERKTIDLTPIFSYPNLVPISLPYHSKLEDDVLIQKKNLKMFLTHLLIALTMNLEVVKARRGRL